VVKNNKAKKQETKKPWSKVAKATKAIKAMEAKKPDWKTKKPPPPTFYVWLQTREVFTFVLVQKLKGCKYTENKQNLVWSSLVRKA
jgi:hypothetical protein